MVIDGKAVRGGDLMLVNAIAQASQRLLGVEAVDRKTNEIPTARTLLQRLDLHGRIVQLDGMHTQHQTVHKILYEHGADYSLILRDNPPANSCRRTFPPVLEKTRRRGGRPEYRAIVTRPLNPRNWGWLARCKLAGSIAALAPTRQRQLFLLGWLPSSARNFPKSEKETHPGAFLCLHCYRLYI